MIVVEGVGEKGVMYHLSDPACASIDCFIAICGEKRVWPTGLPISYWAKRSDVEYCHSCEHSAVKSMLERMENNHVEGCR